MRKRAAIATLAGLLFIPTPAAAWGAAAHRFVMQRAIDLLPSPLKAFCDQHRDELVLRVVDPDLWRTVGWNDDANHFLNLGAPQLGPYPFAALPRDFNAARAKFGMPTLRRFGLLPWREDEEFGNLRRAFEGFTRGVPYASGDAVLFAAVAAHYVQDAYQPLHATNNYDGQLSGQAGVHARFETALFERYQTRLVVAPQPPRPMVDARAQAFDILLASHQLAERVLRADKDASGGRQVYDDAYFVRFFERVKPVLEQQIGEAVSMTASLIIGAWEQAGKPALLKPASQSGR